jgi:hypothetical protein
MPRRASRGGASRVVMIASRPVFRPARGNPLFLCLSCRSRRGTLWLGFFRPVVCTTQRIAVGFELTRGQPARSIFSALACSIIFLKWPSQQFLPEECPCGRGRYQGGWLGVHRGLRDVIDDATMNALFDQEAKLFLIART